jgi:hypothetical protein
MGRKQIEKILQLDTFCVAARILAIFAHREQKKDLLQQEGLQAQALLNLLQAVSDIALPVASSVDEHFVIQLLDFPLLGPAHARILRAMCTLSNHSGLYPASLVLGGVRKTSECAVNGGSYGDIWRGIFEQSTIAIKVVRHFTADLNDEFIKVNLPYSIARLLI